MPSPMLSPLPSPLVSPWPSPSLSPEPTASFGFVSVPRSFTSYTVDGDRIRGFHTVNTERSFEARATPPTLFAFPSFSDPNGQRLLVRIESGPYEGIYVSPEDPDVQYRPGY